MFSCWCVTAHFWHEKLIRQPCLRKKVMMSKTQRERESEREILEKSARSWFSRCSQFKKELFTEKKLFLPPFFCQNREKLVTLSVSSSDVKAVTRWSGGRQADEFIDRVTRCRISAPFWRFCESPWWLLFFLLALMTSRGTTVPGAGSPPESRVNFKLKRERKKCWLIIGTFQLFVNPLDTCSCLYHVVWWAFTWRKFNSGLSCKT